MQIYIYTITYNNNNNNKRKLMGVFLKMEEKIEKVIKMLGQDTFRALLEGWTPT